MTRKRWNETQKSIQISINFPKQTAIFSESLVETQFLSFNIIHTTIEEQELLNLNRIRKNNILFCN